MWLRNRLKRGQASLLKLRNSILLISFILFFLSAKWTLEGAQYAPSSSSFSATGDVEVLYMLGGGRQNSFNKTSYEVGSGIHRLFTPYRFGYRFLGWFTDKSLRRPIEEISTEQSGVLVVYAGWTPQIDNVYNVENYSYHSKAGSVENTTVVLKDLDYSFLEELDIPGMPDTRDNDVLNQIIFSRAQAPQGICLTEEFILISSYSTEDDCMGELMVFDRESGDYMVTLGMDENSHLGGIAFDGENVWVCNSYERSIERISYDFIQLMAYENTGDVVDARDVVDEYSVKNTPSCITYYGGRLWVATHTRVVTSKMVAYHLDSSTGTLTALSEYKIPAKVQGIAFDEDGGVYLSTSYGRSESSYLLRYSSVIALATSPKRPAKRVEMPPCSEEIEVYGDSLYVLFESAGEKYFEGTDGKGKSLSPLDKLLVIPLSQL
jgi:uncharacterized repeat protein (TIGR02543 family)